MKLFGEFLIDSGLIKKDQLILALLEQIKTTPSVTEIVITQKLLTDDQVLDVFKLQVTNQLSFLEAAKTRGVWSQELAERVEKQIILNRMPLGQILVKLGMLDNESLTKSLDEFMGSVEKVPSSPQKEASAVVAPPQSTAEAATVPVGGNGSQSSQSEFAVYLDMWTGSALLLKTLLGDPSIWMPVNLDKMKIAFEEVHKLKGAARLASLDQMGRIISHMEDVLAEVMKQAATLNDPELSKKVESGYSLFVERMDMMAKALEQSATEGDAATSVSEKFKAQEWEDGLLLLKFDLGLSIN